MNIDKKIIFRADGDSTTGLGHMYRLFALVEMLKETYNFVYVTKENSSTEIIPNNYNLKLIPNNVDINEEAKWIVKNFSPNDHIIIADGYQFISSYQKALKNFGFKLIYIDDLVKEYMYADVVINHSPQIKEEYYKREDYTKLVLGLDYALLRPSFLEAAKKNRVFKSFNSVFVNFGGSDHYDLTQISIKALLKISKVKVINVVLGAAYRVDKFEMLKKIAPSKVKLFKNLSEEQMVDLMAASDFAIVPSSNILFELFCVKMPIFSGYFVENQKPAYMELKKRSLISGCGDFKKITVENLHKDLLDFVNLSNPDNFILRQKELIDGKQHIRLKKLIKEIT